MKTHFTKKPKMTKKKKNRKRKVSNSESGPRTTQKFSLVLSDSTPEDFANI